MQLTIELTRTPRTAPLTFNVDSTQEPTLQREKPMKKVNAEMKDQLWPEYDLRSLQIRKLGPARKSFGGSVVRLEPDVAEAFWTAPIP